MPRPKTDPIWRERVFQTAARINARSARQVYATLDKQALQEGWALPSIRVIERFWTAWQALKEQERLPYRDFSWPGSLASGALPWEASPATLELLRQQADPIGLLMRARPNNLDALWFHRLTSVAPDLPVEFRHLLAAKIQIQDVRAGGAFPWFPELELFLSFGPWRGREQREAYEQTISKIEQSRSDPALRDVRQRWAGAEQWDQAAREMILMTIERVLADARSREGGQNG